jgi:hypothetical protein
VTTAATFIVIRGPQAHVRSVEGSCQQGEVRLAELLSLPEQAHGDKEIGKKRTPEFRYRDRIQRSGDDGCGTEADRPSTSARGRERSRIGKTDPSPCLLESYGRQAEAVGRRAAVRATCSLW